MRVGGHIFEVWVIPVCVGLINTRTPSPERRNNFKRGSFMSADETEPINTEPLAARWQGGDKPQRLTQQAPLIHSDGGTRPWWIFNSPVKSLRSAGSISPQVSHAMCWGYLNIPDKHRTKKPVDFTSVCWTAIDSALWNDAVSLCSCSTSIDTPFVCSWEMFPLLMYLFNSLKLLQITELTQIDHIECLFGVLCFCW